MANLENAIFERQTLCEICGRKHLAVGDIFTRGRRVGKVTSLQHLVDPTADKSGTIVGLSLKARWTGGARTKRPIIAMFE